MEKIDLTNLDSMIASLKDDIKNYKNSDAYKKMLDTMAKFYKYSTNNIRLALMQREDLTYLGSMSFWNSQGRYINKGEKAIKILCPVPTITRIEEKDKNGNTILDEDGNPKISEMEEIRFKIGHIFDISQTNGKELNIRGKELVGEGVDLPNFINTMKEIAGVNEIRFEKITDGAKGWYNLRDNEIVIKEGMSDLATTSVILHETAHAIVFSNKDIANTLNRREHEIIAESVAYVTCKKFGLDTSEVSLDYIDSWANSDEKKIESCFTHISKTASSIIERINDKFNLKSELEVKQEVFNAEMKEKKNSKNSKKSTYKGKK